MAATSIIVGGDVCPMGSVQDAFIEGKAAAVFNDLLEDIHGADLAVANLECPLVSRPTPIVKAGPTLGADVRCVTGFAAARWHVLNLANNHSFDHGAADLRETIQTVRAAGLGVVGVGENVAEAKTPLVRQINGIRIVIYAMAEREFSVASDTSPGANPLDLINFVHALRQYKQGGLFIVLFHGGKEFYSLPSPEMLRRCRFMVDMGADAVICSHTHCPLPWEIYAGRPIVYGLGNLIFEPLRAPADEWHHGYLAKLCCATDSVDLTIIPYIQSLGRMGVVKMGGPDRARFLEEMRDKCARLQDPEFITAQWRAYCRAQRETYLASLFAYSRPMRKLRKLLLSTFHARQDRLRSLLCAQCETHQEVLNTILESERVDD